MSENEDVRTILSDWRTKLRNELERGEYRKLMRLMADRGVVLQVENDKVVRYFFKDELTKERLRGMRGSGWLRFGGLRESSRKEPFNVLLWDTEASEPNEVDFQGLGGYRKKYRHSNHSQVVKATNKRIVKSINSMNRK